MQSSGIGRRTWASLVLLLWYSDEGAVVADMSKTVTESSVPLSLAHYCGHKGKEASWERWVWTSLHPVVLRRLSASCPYLNHD
jgi:hypothetical protein